MSRPLRVLVAPDSFKGSLTSLEVAHALAAGWRRARPGDEVRLAPLADGGEGTLAAIEAAGGWERRTARVRDPLGRQIAAPFLVGSGDRAHEAVVEMAAASGLSRLAATERDPFGASSRGTGELLRAALAAGATAITLGIGGSATTDGGRGLLEGLGARVSGPPLAARDWAGVAVELAGLDPRGSHAILHVACDVTNPLLGPTGAAATYAPQKGAGAGDVPVLDARLAAWADALEVAARSRVRDEPGAGAAGGVGFALLAIAARFQSFALRPGVELVMAAAGFAEALATADVVLTGEGRIDAQTGFGKTALGVARAARRAGVRCIAVGGSVEPEGEAALAVVGAEAVPVHERPVPLAEAIAAGAAPIEACGERLANAVR